MTSVPESSTPTVLNLEMASKKHRILRSSRRSMSFSSSSVGAESCKLATGPRIGRNFQYALLLPMCKKHVSAVTTSSPCYQQPTLRTQRNSTHNTIYRAYAHAHDVPQHTYVRPGTPVTWAVPQRNEWAKRPQTGTGMVFTIGLWRYQIPPDTNRPLHIFVTRISVCLRLLLSLGPWVPLYGP